MKKLMKKIYIYFLQLIDLYGLLSDLYQGISTFVYGIVSEHRGHAVVRGGKRRYDEPEQIRMDYFEYAVNRLKNYWFSKDQITGDHESDRIDPNLGYNLGPDSSTRQNSWYLGYGPILKSLGQPSQNNNDEQEPEQHDEDYIEMKEEDDIIDVEDVEHDEQYEDEEDEDDDHDEEQEEESQPDKQKEEIFENQIDENINKENITINNKKESSGILSNIKAGIESIASAITNQQSRPEMEIDASNK